MKQIMERQEFEGGEPLVKRPAILTSSDAYEAFAPELLGFATSMVGRVHAPDVLSAAMVRVLASPKWPFVDNQRAYLYRAVFNEACRWRRRMTLRIDRESRAAKSERFELPDLDPDVRTAVTSLSARQRGVIVLTYWDDLTPSQVAEHLGIGEGSVRRHLARARAHLRKTLAVEGSNLEVKDV